MWFSRAGYSTHWARRAYSFTGEDYLNPNCPIEFLVIRGHLCSSSQQRWLWFLTPLSLRLDERQSGSALYCSARRPILFGSEVSAARQVNKIRHDLGGPKFLVSKYGKSAEFQVRCLSEAC